MVLIETVNPRTPWLQVDNLDLDEGPNLSPSGTTRIEIYFLGDVLIVKETVKLSGVINFIRGYPIQEGVKEIEFTIHS